MSLMIADSLKYVTWLLVENCGHWHMGLDNALSETRTQFINEHIQNKKLPTFYEKNLTYRWQN